MTRRRASYAWRRLDRSPFSIVIRTVPAMMSASWTQSSSRESTHRRLPSSESSIVYSPSGLSKCFRKGWCGRSLHGSGSSIAKRRLDPRSLSRCSAREPGSSAYPPSPCVPARVRVSSSQARARAGDSARPGCVAVCRLAPISGSHTVAGRTGNVQITYIAACPPAPRRSPSRRRTGATGNNRSGEIPRHTDDPSPPRTPEAPADRGFREVGDTGLEPVTSALSRRRSPS